MGDGPRFPAPGEQRRAPGETGDPYRDLAQVPAAPPRSEVVVVRPEPPRDDPAAPRASARRDAPRAVEAALDLGHRHAASGPWFLRHPRLCGGALLGLGVFEGATVIDFFFNDGTISAGLTSLLFYASSPLMLAMGLWLVVFGVPSEQPGWWRTGIRVAGGIGAVASLWLASRLQAAPKVSVDPRTHRPTQLARPPAADRE